MAVVLASKTFSITMEGSMTDEVNVDTVFGSFTINVKAETHDDDDEAATSNTLLIKEIRNIMRSRSEERTELNKSTVIFGV